MSGISKLASIFTKFHNDFVRKSMRNSNNILFKSNSNPLMIFQTRESHGRTMFIRPGKFYTKKYFDMLVNLLRFIILFIFE